MISTLGGLFNLNHFDQSSCANDVIVIRQKDGTLRSTPFNVRFGRAQMWSYVGRVVQVEVNGELTTAVMKIGKDGKAYWLQPTYGVFGDASHGAATATQTENAGGSVPPAAAAAAAVAGVSGTDCSEKGDAKDLHIVGSRVGAVEEGETLLLNAAELLHPPDSPESPPELPSLSEADDDAWETGEGAAAQVLPPSVAFPPGQRDPTTEAQPPSEGDGEPLFGDADQERRPGSHNLGFQDPSANLPLLHTAEDGHLTIETRAIHSAGDVQEARLALRAMVAAEKSRKRLSKMSFVDDPYLLKTAREEGHLGDATNYDKGGDADALGIEGGVGDDANYLGGDCPKPPTVEVVVDAADVSPSCEAAVRAANGGSAAQVSFTFTPVAAGDGTDMHTTDGLVTQSAGKTPEGESGGLPPLLLSPQPPAEEASAASSATSVTGSTDSYKVVDEDAYFLDPLDTDSNYAALYGEEVTLLKEASFASSVTSGVSLPDPSMMPGTTAGNAATVHRGSAGTTGGELCSNVEGSPASRVGASAMPQPQTSGAVASPFKGSLPPQSLTPSSPPQTAENEVVSSAKEADKAAESHTRTGVSGTPSAGVFSAPEEVMDADGRPVQLPPTGGGPGGGPYFTRTLLPVEADLWKLHLKEGCNTVRYLARKDKGDAVSISCNIFLWNWTDRLVVSDVDGTITKSDLLGHFYAMLGKGADWTHPGICNLYSKIEGNGYRMVYLTARSVSQINQTKSYLFTLQQDGVRLPMGPVLTAPQRFFTALTQEVSKQSHVFKIACLTSVRAAFPPSTKPFFAGFGNRYNDVISYDAAGIPTHKIFIIDPSSVLHVCLVRQTYRDLGHLVDVTFPPVKRHPVVLRAPRHLHRTQGTGASVSPAKEATFGGRDRHAYPRSLLHCSSSASTSSATSISSAASSSSDYLDVREEGSSGSPDFGAEGSPRYTSGSGASDGDGFLAGRHVSAAFSLVDLEPVHMIATGALSGSAASPREPPELAKGGDPTPTGPLPWAASELPVLPVATTASPVALWSQLHETQKQGSPSTRSALPAGKFSTSTARAHRSTYNYDRRATFAELNDDDDDAAAALAEEEEVPVDPEFSSFVYWRMDPHDLITVPATASMPSLSVTHANTKKVPETTGAVTGSTQAPKNVAAVTEAATTFTKENGSAKSAAAAAPSARSQIGGTAADKASLGAASPSRISVASDAAAPPPSGGDGRHLSVSSLTVANSLGKGPGRGADAPVSSPTTEMTSPDAVSETRKAQPCSPTIPGRSQAGAVRPCDDREGSAETNVDAVRSTLPQHPLPPLTTGTQPASSGGGNTRGFFSAFSFGRSRAVKLPLSPTSQKAAEVCGAAQRRALSHPDAHYYYVAQQPQPQPQPQQLQSQQPAPPLAPFSASGIPATTKAESSAPPPK
ncbi:lipin, putative [Leishmania tarentolae]|uniref:Lipin, putative n=1 Tax=Leishmania tarentolae TaxID=5689 RepID=A0A640KA23_LEITA|nr:lipin, putative [Leishmania tarentolae]